MKLWQKEKKKICMRNTYKEKWLLKSYVVIFIQVSLKTNKETKNSWNVFSILLALTDMLHVRFSNPELYSGELQWILTW